MIIIIIIGGRQSRWTKTTEESLSINNLAGHEMVNSCIDSSENEIDTFFFLFFSVRPSQG